MSEKGVRDESHIIGQSPAKTPIFKDANGSGYEKDTTKVTEIIRRDREARNARGATDALRQFEQMGGIVSEETKLQIAKANPKKDTAARKETVRTVLYHRRRTQ